MFESLDSILGASGRMLNGIIDSWGGEFSPHTEVTCVCGTGLSPHTEVACACGTGLSSYRSGMCHRHSSLLIQKWNVPVAQISPHTEVT